MFAFPDSGVLSY